MIIEDNEDLINQLKWGLSKEYHVLTALDKERALELVIREKPGVILLDLGLPPDPEGTEEGFACLRNILEENPLTKVVVITGREEKGNSLKAISMGAYDYYIKPIDLSELRIILKRAFYLHHIEMENRELQEIISKESIFEEMIGNSPKMQEVFTVIKKIASLDVTVLITGESGTGKEMVARAIHQRSPRKNGLFVPINCGGIPETLIESELFGYERGAFTDAKTQRIGLIEKANGGTLFLDEIGELPLQLQVKILRFLQDRKIQRIGGREEIEVNTRIITATNTDLKKATVERKFREDLYFRIAVITIELPPLRERGDDILLLANSFLNKFNHAFRKNIKGFSPSAIDRIRSYNWPGNVRELENKVQRAVVMAEDQIIKPEDLLLGSYDSGLIGDDERIPTLKRLRESIESEIIKKALINNEWNISRTAQELGVSRPTLHELINKYGLRQQEEKKGHES